MRRAHGGSRGADIAAIVEGRPLPAFFAVAAAAAAALLVLSPAGEASTTAVTATSGDSVAKATRVRVLAGSPSEFRFKLSVRSSRRGVVRFVVTNRGQLPHDLKIAGKRTKLLQPGKSQTLRVVFKRRGTYRYLCTVSGNAAAGMKGTFRVR
jgi:uncharacterized cupredoxin-like copper-binding protein